MGRSLGRFLTALLAAVACTALAQQPRVGLALSGGGARGAAHIGVLKVLEELHVPVHCIVGTSMGAVVGGAYAAGTTVEAMQNLVATTDWSGVFTDRPPRSELAIRRKAEDYKGLATPELGLRDGAVLLPKGIVAGVTIENFLRQLAAPAAGIDEFSRLPIPFRAIAADIENGQAVELQRGSLMQAMRASMAIPGAVSPVEVDGRLLVDGGIVDNLPIDVARKTCADVVIAVNIGTPALKREDIDSAVGVVSQLVSLLGKAAVDRQVASLGERDVLIAPELGDITAASFERQSEAIRIGEAAARGAAAHLRRYSIPAADHAALRGRQVQTASVLGKVDAIRFDGIERTNAEVLTALMQSRPGEELSPQQLGADLRRIYGRGDFEAVDYRIEVGPGGRVLAIPVRENSMGPNYLRFGLGLASDFRGTATFNLLASHRRTWINRAGGEWLVEGQLGRDNQIYTEFYQPLELRGRFFVSGYAQLGRGLRGIYLEDVKAAEYGVRDGRLGVDLGMTLGTWGEIRLGPLARRVHANIETGQTVLPEVEGRSSALRLRVFGDTLDTPWFPRSGHRAYLAGLVGLDASGAQQKYRRLEAGWSTALSHEAHALQIDLYGGTNLSSPMPPYDAFVLGGPFRLSGYRINQFAGLKSAFASARYYKRLVGLPTILGSGVYAGASVEAGRISGLYDGRAGTGTLWSGTLYLAAETFMGPAAVGAGFGGGSNRTVFLLVGVP